MSLLPPKILKIMEWIGFSGDGTDAITKLNECADSDTLRSQVWTFWLNVTINSKKFDVHADCWLSLK